MIFCTIGALWGAPPDKRYQSHCSHISGNRGVFSFFCAVLCVRFCSVCVPKCDCGIDFVVGRVHYIQLLLSSKHHATIDWYNIACALSVPRKKTLPNYKHWSQSALALRGSYQFRAAGPLTLRVRLCWCWFLNHHHSNIHTTALDCTWRRRCVFTTVCTTRIISVRLWTHSTAAQTRRKNNVHHPQE